MAAQVKDRVFDWLSYYADVDPSRLAAVDLGTRRWLTYGQLDDRATRLATALRDEHGVRAFDRVAFLAHNSTDHFEAMFACWKLGAMFVPLNWRLAPGETAQVLRHCAPQVLFCDAGLEPQLDGSDIHRVLRRPGEPDCGYEALVRGHAPGVRMQDVSFDTPNMLLYTSGTTGRPKGVIYTHRMTHNIVVHAALHARVRSHTRTLTHLPLFHVAGLYAVSTPQFHYGGAVVVMRQWDTQECLRHLQDPALAITHVVGVPTHYLLLSQLPEFATADFPTLEVAAVGGAPVPLPLLETWERKGCHLSQSFGMTEAFSVAWCPPEKAREKIGSAGHALMHIDVRIGDDEGQELPRGTVGEIQVRGPGITPGYWNDPEATAAAFTADGWFRTGDVATISSEGYMQITDRTKDLIKSGGEWISSVALENALMAHPNVAEAAVIAIPDERWSERPLAVVVCRAANTTIDSQELLDYLAAQFARFWLPERIVQVDAIPKTSVGKFDKKVIRQQFAEGIL